MWVGAAVAAAPLWAAALPAHAQAPTCDPTQRPCLPKDPNNAAVYLGRQGNWTIFGETTHTASQTFNIYLVPDVPANRVCRAQPCGYPMTVQWRRYQADCYIGRYYMLMAGQGLWNDPSGVNGNAQYTQQFAQNIPAANGPSIYENTPFATQALKVCIEEGLLGVPGYNPYPQPQAAAPAAVPVASPHVAEVTVRPAK